MIKIYSVLLQTYASFALVFLGVLGFPWASDAGILLGGRGSAPDLVGGLTAPPKPPSWMETLRCSVARRWPAEARAV